MNYMGRMVFNNFRLMPPSASVTADDLARLSRDDLLIALSTSPYATETVRLVQAACQLGIPSIAVTDAARLPIAQSASIRVCVTITKHAQIHQMAPVISAIEQILKTCYEDPATNAFKRITNFAESVKSIKGYWKPKTSRPRRQRFIQQRPIRQRPRQSSGRYRRILPGLFLPPDILHYDKMCWQRLYLQTQSS